MEEFVYVGNGQRVPRDVVKVQFHPSVTKVEDQAFEGCYDLWEVVLNDGLDKIGYRAFGNCESLPRIAIPSTLIEIDKYAFQDCRSLPEVGLHEGLHTIGDGAFKGCSSLDSITLPSTVTEISKYAFQNCNSLQEVGLHEGLQNIGYRAFADCTSLERFTFPAVSTRLNNVIEVETNLGRTRQLNEINVPRLIYLLDEINTIRGDMINHRRGSELFVPGAVLRGGSNWNTIKASLDQIINWIRFYEIKEETTLFELALWKTRLDQADEATDINREAYRIEVPGPVKDAILQYL